MSRGPGTLQRRVLETLATYRRFGPALGWRWPGARSRYSDANYADHGSIWAYERGWYIPVWMLLRDLECTRPELSRALKSLERQRLVYRLDGSLNGLIDRQLRYGANAKFVCLTEEGEAWLKRQQLHSAEVGTYQPMPAGAAP